MLYLFFEGQGGTEGEREREREKERDTHRENLKEAPHPAQSLMWGLISQPLDYDLS